MAGNEIEIVKYLFDNIGRLNLQHLGELEFLGAPDNSNKGYRLITEPSQINLVATQNSRKKADIYINGEGVSLKQQGSSFAYNRLQRAQLFSVFRDVGIIDIESHISKLDEAVDYFHKNDGRNIKWSTAFAEQDFKKLLKYLMMLGSGRYGLSKHQASYILEAPKVNINSNNIHIYTFDEYFNKYKDVFYIAIRRMWIGQISNSEHNRAIGLSKKRDNMRWVYNTVSGEPEARDGKIWRDNIAEKDRKSVYVISIEKTVNK